jgi:hypothetical protein
MPIELLLQRPSYMSQRQVSPEEIRDWASKRGYTIPDDYTRFIARWNGGTVKPYVFRQSHPDFQQDGGAMILDTLFDWDEALGASDCDLPQSQRHLPQGYLAIGSDLGGGAYVTMCIGAGSVGQICVAERRRYGIWGFEDLDRLAYVAESFTAFLGALHEPKTGDFYNGYWTDHNPDLETAIAIRL